MAQQNVMAMSRNLFFLFIHMASVTGAQAKTTDGFFSTDI
jgi:hypothetical protein